MRVSKSRHSLPARAPFAERDATVRTVGHNGHRSPRGEQITIAGGGLSGLAAALTLARAGRRVVVYERAAACGARRNGDIEGLENWIFPDDPVKFLYDHRLTTQFEYCPMHAFQYINSAGVIQTARARRPYFYLVRRGADKGSLDRAFQNAAEEAGIEIHFNKAKKPVEVDIFAGGTRHADAYVQGVTFTTDAADGAYLLLGEAYASSGYAYCLIWNGRGTIATVYKARRSDPEKWPGRYLPPQLSRDPKRAEGRLLIATTMRRFQQVLGMDIQQSAPFGAFGACPSGHGWGLPGGSGSRHTNGESSRPQAIPLASGTGRTAPADRPWATGIRRAVRNWKRRTVERSRMNADEDKSLLVGEAAGFQDALFGFGMNYAIRSGILAAQALLGAQDRATAGRRYRRAWGGQLSGRLLSGAVNRRLFEALGEARRLTLAGRIMVRGSVLDVLRGVARPSLKKRLLARWPLGIR